MAADGCRGGFCEKAPEPAPCRTQQVVVCPKTDPARVRAEPIADGSSGSAVTHLGKSKKPCTTAAEREK